MTKEQILGNYYREHTETDKAIYEAMEHYKDQEVAKEREKAKKLVEALEEIADMTGNILIYKKAKQSLTEYEK
jgi:hypothetical protein